MSVYFCTTGQAAKWQTAVPITVLINFENFQIAVTGPIRYAFIVHANEASCSQIVM